MSSLRLMVRASTSLGSMVQSRPLALVAFSRLGVRSSSCRRRESRRGLAARTTRTVRVFQLIARRLLGAAATDHQPDPAHHHGARQHDDGEPQDGPALGRRSGTIGFWRVSFGRMAISPSCPASHATILRKRSRLPWKPRAWFDANVEVPRTTSRPSGFLGVVASGRGIGLGAGQDIDRDRGQHGHGPLRVVRVFPRGLSAPETFQVGLAPRVPARRASGVT